MGVKHLENNKHYIVDEHLVRSSHTAPKVEIDYQPSCIALHPDNFNMVAVGTTQGIIYIIDLEKEVIVHESVNNV